MTTLREELARPGSFVVATELVTSRGLFSAEGGRALQETARELAANPRMTVLSITDNPGGNAMLAPDTLGSDLLSLGQEVIIHLACKDWNRNALESRGWKLGSEGFRNVLALSGDYPITGHRGRAAPVFDIDSVGLLALLADMNTGLSDERRPELLLGKPDFFLGCVVTNHKRHEREVMPQYFKLRKKIAAGARFVINQIGYDTRKDDELLRWLRREQLAVSVLANVYLLSRGAARAFHRGAIPGVIVTDELLEIVERQAASPDRGRAYFVDLAARHVAVARGLGFSGVYLGGHAPASTFDEILTVADTYAERRLDRTRSRDSVPAPGRVLLLRAGRGDRSLVGRRQCVVPRVEAQPETDLRVPARYRFSRMLHQAAFKRTSLFPPAVRRSAQSNVRHVRLARLPMRSSRPPRCRSSGAGTAATAHCPRSRTSAPSRCARRTNATAPAAAPATGSARSTTPSASGRRRMSD